MRGLIYVLAVAGVAFLFSPWGVPLWIEPVHSSIVVKQLSPQWQKYTVSMSGANWTVNGVSAGARTAGLTQTVTLFTVPANTMIAGITVKTGTSFAATGLVSLVVTGGIGGTPAGYFGSVNLVSAVSSTNFLASPLIGGNFSLDLSSQNFSIAFTAVGATLDTLSAGSFDVWVLTSQLP